MPKIEILTPAELADIFGRCVDLITADDVERLRGHIQALTEQHRWIPIAPETMPKPGLRVLLLTKYLGQLIGWIQRDGAWADANGLLTGDFAPSCWMELPAPQEESSER